MARKNLIYSYQFISPAAPTNSTTTSNSTKVDQLDNASIALTWTASTLVAELTVQAKNGDNGDWRTLDFGSPISVSGAAGAHEIVLLLMPFTDLRVVLTVSSGSGTVKAVLTSKTTGG